MFTTKQIKAIKYLIANSVTIKSDFFKKLLIWLINQSKGLTKSVVTSIKIKDYENSGHSIDIGSSPNINAVLVAADCALTFSFASGSFSKRWDQNSYTIFLSYEDYGHRDSNMTHIKLNREEVNKISLTDDSINPWKD